MAEKCDHDKNKVHPNQLPEIEIATSTRNPDGVCLDYESIKVRGKTLKECEDTLKRMRKK